MSNQLRSIGGLDLNKAPSRCELLRDLVKEEGPEAEVAWHVRSGNAVANTMRSYDFNLVKSTYHSRQGLCSLFRSLGLSVGVLGSWDAGNVVNVCDARTGSKRLWAKV